jgi:hypothetical protein
MRIRRGVLQFTVPFTLTPALCGNPLHGTVVGGVNADNGDLSAKTGLRDAVWFPPYPPTQYSGCLVRKSEQF